MAVHWAWGFSLGGSDQNYADSNWGTYSINYAFTAAPFPRHPLIGYGGQTIGAHCGSTELYETAPFPAGALHDGQVQLHLYQDNVAEGFDVDLLREDGGILLRVRNPGNVGVGVQVQRLEVSSCEPSAALTLRGTATTAVVSKSWFTLGIRLHSGGAAGDIQVSVDGVVTNIVTAGAVGATSDWNRILISGYNLYCSGITVWDDGAADPGLTTTRWVTSLRPHADDVHVNWTSTGANYYDQVNEATISTASYCETSTAAAEIRFDVDSTDVSASWAPDSIDAVSVVASARGASTLVDMSPVTDDGVNNLVGTEYKPLDGETNQQVNAVFLTQADGASAWSAGAAGIAEIDGQTWGVVMT